MADGRSDVVDGGGFPYWMRAIDDAVVKLTPPATQIVPMPGMAEKR
jgi:hypothetical protein